MTTEFEQILFLAAESISGQEYQGNLVEDIGLLKEKAKEQGINYMIMSSLVKRKLATDAEELMIMSAVATNIKRRAFIENIIKILQSEGVQCLLLKGDAVSRLYYEQDVRISSDTDILIKPEDEKKTSMILEKTGFEVESRSKNGHHFKAYHKLGGMLEIHIALYQKSVEDIIFKNKLRYNQKCYVMPNGIETLGITDGIIYITSHFIKHFIKAGAGIRQMAD